MIGIIVTGHNHFATGIKSALELIAGQHEKFVALDFDDVIHEGYLKNRFIETLEGELKDCEQVICYCDLLSGTPFQTALNLALSDYPQINVVYGTNLPLLIESVLARDNESSLEEILEIVDQAKEFSIGVLDKNAQKDDDEF